MSTGTTKSTTKDALSTASQPAQQPSSSSRKVSLSPLPYPPTFRFDNIARWEEWLSTHHDDPKLRLFGLWLKIDKSGTPKKQVTYVEALDIAHCHGWVGREIRPYWDGDTSCFWQKMTPRRKRGPWSKHSIKRAELLVERGLMTPAGQAEIDAAKAGGRWALPHASRATREHRDDAAGLSARTGRE
ncbi:hypothetical protein QBC46DRAFT_438129 [Diplogelasinospora grovesii]|uniref:Uncharacterized protein n=1 Tax=Diplogelasinospora grovesii TaxID=303347 RepID=A0AAN6S340_9PEZI|nr:hypothetical protein QBC46DRAFT_438129 [Diplogelasinospora grovesii]